MIRTGGTVKVFMLACLPAIVAGLVWLLLGETPTPGTASSQARQVRTMLAADSSGHGNHGIIQGQVEMGLPGHDGGRAYSFTSRDAWVQVPSSPGLNPGERDFLITAWVSLQTTPGPGETYDVVRKGLGYTYPGEFKLEVLGGGRVRCTAKDDRGRMAVVTSAGLGVANGVWHRIGCARVGAEWGVLVDDTVTTSLVTLGSVTNTVALSIGGKYGFEDRPEGRVDDVKIFIGSSPGFAQGDFLTVVRALEQQAASAWWRLDEAAVSVAGR